MFCYGRKSHATYKMISQLRVGVELPGNLFQYKLHLRIHRREISANINKKQTLVKHAFCMTSPYPWGHLLQRIEEQQTNHGRNQDVKALKTELHKDRPKMYLTSRQFTNMDKCMSAMQNTGRPRKVESAALQEFNRTFKRKNTAKYRCMISLFCGNYRAV